MHSDSLQRTKLLAGRKFNSSSCLVSFLKCFEPSSHSSRFEIVAGIVPKSVVPPGATRPKTIACIGDEEIIESKGKNSGGVFCIPTRPRPTIPIALKLGDCQLHISDRVAMETRLAANIAKSLASLDAHDAKILSRTLKIGQYILEKLTKI